MKHMLAIQGRRILLVLLSAFGCVLVWLSHDAHANSKGFAAHFCGQLGTGCDRAFDSPWAVFPPGSHDGDEKSSVPLTVVGMLHFGFLLVWFLVVGIPSYARRWWHVVPTIEITAALVMVILLLRVIVAEQLWCVYCITGHLITLLLGIGIYLAWPGKQADSIESVPRPNHFVAFGTLLMSCLLAIIILQSAGNQRLANARYHSLINALINRHFGQASVEISVEAGDPIRPATTPGNQHTLIVFFDAQCPPCKQFLAYIDKTILPLFNGRLTVVYKHYPMARRCNPMAADLHPHACEAARLVEAARKQGGIEAFLQMATLVYDHKGTFDGITVLALAQQSDLDGVQFERDFNDPELANLIKRDIQLGAELRLRRTPCAILDGRDVAGQLMAAPEFWHAAAARE